MNKGFTVECRIHPINLDEPKWCFCMGGSFKSVINLAKKRRWWDTKDELIDALSSLGITGREYSVRDGIYSHDGMIKVHP